MLDFAYASICHKNPQSRWDSPLIHFLARCGLSPKDGTYRDGPQFSQMLAAFSHGCRLLAYSRHTLVERSPADEQDTLHSAIERIQVAYLHDKADAPMGEILSLLAYAMAKNKGQTHRPSVIWGHGNTKDTLYYHGNPVPLARLVLFVQGTIRKAEGILRSHLLMDPTLDLETVALDLADDMTSRGNGQSFIVDVRNAKALHQSRRAIPLRISANPALAAPLFAQVDNQHVYRSGGIQAYYKHAQAFLDLLMVVIHLTSGQPARGSELLTLRYANSATSLRNFYIQDGQVMIVTDYYKNRMQHGLAKVTPRFLPRAVGRLFVAYVVQVLPFIHFLHHRSHSTPPENLGIFLFARPSDGGLLDTAALTRVLRKESAVYLGWAMCVLAWRHIAISFDRRFNRQRGPEGPSGEYKGTDSDEEGVLDDIRDLQAGHSSRTADRIYGIRSDVLQGLTAESIARFRAVTAAWHGLLHLVDAELAPVDSHLPQTKTPPEIDQGLLVSATTPAHRNPQLPVSPPSAVTTLKRRLSESIPWDPSTGTESDPFPEEPPASTPPSVVASASAVRRAPLTPFLSSPRLPIPPAKKLKLDGVWENRRRPEEAALQGLQRLFGAGAGFRSDAQRECLVEVSKGERKPILLILPTGAGKSSLFMAPAALPDARVTVVILPYTALKADLEARAKQAGIPFASFHKFYRGHNASLVFASIEQFAGGLDHYLRVMAEGGWLHRIVFDECHVRLTEWQFRERALKEMNRLVEYDCQVLLLTATLPPNSEEAFRSAMGLPEDLTVLRYPTVRPNLRYTVQWVDVAIPRGRAKARIDDTQNAIIPALIELIRGPAALKASSDRGIIFCPLIEQTSVFQWELQRQLGLPAAEAYNGEMSKSQKAAAMKRWQAQGNWIVATKGLGAGVDFPNVRVVINAGVGNSDSLVEYAQQSGRAGRDGRVGDCFVVLPRNASSNVDSSPIPLAAMTGSQAFAEFCLTTGCRRRVLQGYLDGASVSCGSQDQACDNCASGGIDMDYDSVDEVPPSMSPDSLQCHNNPDEEPPSGSPDSFPFDPVRLGVPSLRSSPDAYDSPTEFDWQALFNAQPQLAELLTVLSGSQISRAPRQPNRALLSASLPSASPFQQLSTPVNTGSPRAPTSTPPTPWGSIHARSSTPQRSSISPAPASPAYPPAFQSAGTLLRNMQTAVPSDFPRLENGRATANLWSQVETALSQVYGNCPACYVSPGCDYLHAVEACQRPLAKDFLAMHTLVRRNVHYERNSCCFTCLLPASRCRVRFERKRCELPPTALSLGVAVHMFKSQVAARVFGMEGYPEGGDARMLAAWLSKTGHIADERVLNCVRLVEFAVAKLRVIRQ